MIDHLSKIFFLILLSIFFAQLSCVNKNERSEGDQDFTINEQSHLIKAIVEQKIDDVKRLLAEGADPFERSRDGTTALDHAINGKNSAIIQLVVNHQNALGETPLIKAVYDQNILMVKKLLANGARLDLKKKDETSAIDIARTGKSREILEMLEQASLLASKLQGNGSAEPITVNSEFSNWGHNVPKTTVVKDYVYKDMKVKGLFASYRGLMHINLGSAFESHLPEPLQQQLKANKLFQKNAVDIFFVVQSAEFRDRHIAIKRDGSDFTRLLPHAWADPTVPLDYKGDRLKRDFLFGLFEAEQSIAHQVQIGELKPFEVHTHDNGFSPDNARINIDPTKSHVFYSLVIGEIYPSNEKRANVTLLWVLNKNDTHAFLKATQKQVFTDASGKKVELAADVKPYRRGPNKEWFFDVPGLDSDTTEELDWQPIDETVGQFLSTINNNSTFKGTPLVEKLDKLLGFEPKK